MLDQQLIVDDFQVDLDNLRELHVGTQRWYVEGQAPVDGYYAGREAYEESLRIAEETGNNIAEPGGLSEVPTDTDFTAYFQLHQPEGLSARDMERWRSYFMLGWYSKVLLIDYY